MTRRTLAAATSIVFFALLASTPAIDASSVTWDFFNDVLVSVGNESAKQVESSIAVRGNNVNNLIAGFMEKQASNQYRCRISTSTDTGTTFTDRGLLPVSTGDDVANDPVVTSNSAGTYFAVCLEWDNDFPDNRKVYYWVSANGGSTWSGPNTIVTGTAADKPWITTDLKDPTSSYRDNVYACWSDENSSHTQSTIKFRRIWPTTGTTRTVATGSVIGETNGIVNMCNVVVGEDGIVYITWARLTSSSQGQVELRRSFDGGSTLETLTQTVKTFGRIPSNVQDCSFIWGCLPGSNNHAIRVHPNPNAAIDNNYNLFVTFSSWSSSSLTDTRYVKVTNCKTVNTNCTYSSSINVVNDGGIARDQFFPEISVSAKSNTIHITSLDRRNSASNTNWQPWHYHCHLASSSCTSASSFSVTSITTQSSWNFDGDYFVGDYNGIASSSSKEAHATFPDVRLWGGNQDYNVWSNRLT